MTLKYEIQSAEMWFDSVRNNEINWIQDKVDAVTAQADWPIFNGAKIEPSGRQNRIKNCLLSKKRALDST